MSTEKATPKRFQIEVGEEVLADLKRRLAETRLPDEIPGSGWSYGTEKSTLQDFLRYWRDEFDWPAQQRMLNSFDHFTLPVRGLSTHFIHQRSPHPDAKPLLLLHGWPGSVVEFYKLIPLLTNPKDSTKAFHVVAPSLPGYGFSEAPKRRGFDTFEIAQSFDELMGLLGYPKYYCQGGDWGAIIAKCIGIIAPKNCLAIHVNMAVAGPPKPTTLTGFGQLALLGLGMLGVHPSSQLTQEELKNLKQSMDFVKKETGYQKIQGTKPQTLGYALNDSPAGLLAWILEKFRSWTDCDGNVETVLTKDEILTDVMIYWVTQSITSSTRLYYETLGPHTSSKRSITEFCTVPTGVANFPKELYLLPKSWIARGYNLKHWSVMKKGGHFAALERPQELAADIHKFFWALPKSNL